MIPRLSSQSHLSSLTSLSEQETSNLEEKNATFASHSVTQKETNTGYSQEEAVLSINPTMIQQKVESNPTAILEQQISGMLGELALKGFEFSLDGLTISPENSSPLSIHAQISCRTSYDNRENVPKALQALDATLQPVLTSFIQKYTPGYSQTPGLSPTAKEEFKRAVQAILTEYMPKDSPTLDTVLSFHKEKPVVCLGTKYTQKKGAGAVHSALEQLMKQYGTGALIFAIGEINIESEDAGKQQNVPKKDATDFRNILKGKKE